MATHPDFQALPWARTLLSDPQTELLSGTHQGRYKDSPAPNPMFRKLLNQPGAVNAQVSFRRPAREPDACHPKEHGMLLSLGHDVDGMHGRAHGGFNGMVLDQICGSVAESALPMASPPATATLTIDYKAPVGTPCVVLARAWITEVAGRKIRCRTVLEDSKGKVLATATALFIAPRPAAL